jgi:hypothetical protein
MTLNELDDRTPTRLALDEAIASEPPLPPPELSAGATPTPMEAHMRPARKPLPVAGVVETGVVRLLDPSVRPPERSRVILVASEPM